MNDVAIYQMIAMKKALFLETKGMKLSRGKSMYAQVKREFNLRGSKQSVYTQFCELVEQVKQGQVLVYRRNAP